MRRAAAVSASLCVMLFAAAALAAGDPRKEKERLNPADMGNAKSMLVRRGDLGAGWRGTAVPPDEKNSFECPGFDPDMSAFTITGKGEAAFVHSTGASLFTFAELYVTRAQAIGDFRTAARPALARCFRWGFERKAKADPEPGVEIRVLSSRMLRAPGLGERSASYRMVIRASSGGRSARLYVDMLVFQKQRSIGAVMAVSPIQPLAGMRTLALSMVARAA